MSWRDDRRHRPVRIASGWRPRRASLCIRTIDVIAGVGSGSGLHGLQERAESVGGTLDTVAREGEWIVHAVLPVARR